MVHYPEKDQGVIPEGVTISQKGIISDPDNTTITMSFIMVEHDLKTPKTTKEIDENNKYFPFTTSPKVSLKGVWTGGEYVGTNSRRWVFSARLKSPKMDTLYKAVYSGEWKYSVSREEVFSCQTTTGWEEKTRFVIPVELEMPEEVLPLVQKIRASLLIGN